jgi:hypothetical protein
MSRIRRDRTGREVVTPEDKITPKTPEKVCGSCGGSLMGKVVLMKAGLTHLMCAVQSFEADIDLAAEVTTTAKQGLAKLARGEDHV